MLITDEMAKQVTGGVNANGVKPGPGTQTRPADGDDRAKGGASSAAPAKAEDGAGGVSVLYSEAILTSGQHPGPGEPAIRV